VNLRKDHYHTEIHDLFQREPLECRLSTRSAKAIRDLVSV